jgi:hypothetical protein
MQKIECCYCGSLLSSVYSLNNHQKRSKKCKIIQNTDYKSLNTCKLCNKRFITNHKCKKIDTIIDDYLFLKSENNQLKERLSKLQYPTINTALKFTFSVDKTLRELEKKEICDLFINNYKIKSKIK